MQLNGKTVEFVGALSLFSVFPFTLTEHSLHLGALEIVAILFKLGYSGICEEVLVEAS